MKLNVELFEPRWAIPLGGTIQMKLMTQYMFEFSHAIAVELRLGSDLL
jgi:hypothetical protein